MFLSPNVDFTALLESNKLLKVICLVITWTINFCYLNSALTATIPKRLFASRRWSQQTTMTLKRPAIDFFPKQFQFCPFVISLVGFLLRM